MLLRLACIHGCAFVHYFFRHLRSTQSELLLVQCGQFGTAETGHSQYQGTIYCPSTETVPKELWLEQIKKITNVNT